MKIAILGGTGSLGKGLASRWIKAGHDVLIGSRDLPKDPVPPRIAIFIQYLLINI